MDSDSDDSLLRAAPPPRKSKACSQRSSATTNIDVSDSDDSLLEKASTFGRKRKKREESSKAKADRILDAALNSCRKDTEEQRIIAQIKREEVDEDDLVANARQLQQESIKKPRSLQSTRAIVEGTASLAKRQHDPERVLALVEAADTQQTSSLGSRSTVSWKQSDGLPSSDLQALEYLEHILLETRDQLQLEVRNFFYYHLRQGTLHSFLLTSKLSRKLDHAARLPKPLIHWLFLTASTSTTDVGCEKQTMETLARGAYSTLSRFWANCKGFSDACFVLSLEDMLIQLQEWFGLCLERGNRDENNHRTPKDNKLCNRNQVPLARFLHLWDIAFSRRMISLSNTDVLDHAKKCIIALLLTGLDQMFESNKTLPNAALSYLQRNLGHILDAAETVCGEDTNKYIAWVRSLTDGIIEALSELGPGASGAEDADDPRAWLCHSRSIRNILSSNRACGDDKAADLCVLVSARVLKKCFEVEDWDADITSAFRRWKLPNGSVRSRQWQAIASSYVALENISSNFPHENGPLCLAAVEISHLCLQAAVTLFENHGLESQDDHLGYLQSAYEEIEIQCRKVAGKSNSLVMNNPHFLRANYYVNCIRQYPRLGKVSAKQSIRSVPTNDLQTTLDSWVSHPEL